MDTLEKLAEKRWSSDVDSLNFEAIILNVLQTNDGKHALGDWFHGRGLHKDVSRDDFSLSFDTCPPIKNYSKRLHTAALLIGLVYTRPHNSNAYAWNGKWWYVCGCQDYEDYLTWRKTIAGATAAAILNIQTTVRS